MSRVKLSKKLAAEGYTVVGDVDYPKFSFNIWNAACKVASVRGTKIQSVWKALTLAKDYEDWSAKNILMFAADWLTKQHYVVILPKELDVHKLEFTELKEKIIVDAMVNDVAVTYVVKSLASDAKNGLFMYGIDIWIPVRIDKMDIPFLATELTFVIDNKHKLFSFVNEDELSPERFPYLDKYKGKNSGTAMTLMFTLCTLGIIAEKDPIRNGNVEDLVAPALYAIASLNTEKLKKRAAARQSEATKDCEIFHVEKSDKKLIYRKKNVSYVSLAPSGRHFEDRKSPCEHNVESFYRHVTHGDYDLVDAEYVKVADNYGQYTKNGSEYIWAGVGKGDYKLISGSYKEVTAGTGHYRKVEGFKRGSNGDNANKNVGVI